MPFLSVDLVAVTEDAGMRSTTLSRPKCPERLTATVDLGSQRFSFRLFTRRLLAG